MLLGPYTVRTGGASFGQRPPQRAAAAGAARAPSSGGCRAGPIGADGARPLLSWAQRATAAGTNGPTRPAPPTDTAASGAARPPAAAGSRGGHNGQGGASGDVAARGATTSGSSQERARDGIDETADMDDVDDGTADGFRVVRRKGAGRPSDGATGGSGSPAKDGVDRRCNATEEMDGGDIADVGDDDGWQCDEGSLPPKPSHQILLEELQECRSELKALRRQWPEGHWAVLAAQERVDLAEAAWRSEKPSPLPSRALLRAEQAVRKSEARADGIASRIDELDGEYERRRAELEEALMDERHKLRDLRLALVKAQEEVGAVARRGGGGMDCAEERSGAEARNAGAIRAAVSVLETDVAPELKALVEGLESCGADDCVKQTAQMLMAKLSSFHGDLTSIATGPPNRWGHDREDYGACDGGYHDIADGDSLPALSERDWDDGGWRPWDQRGQHWSCGQWGADEDNYWGYGHRNAHECWWGNPGGHDDTAEGEPPNKKGKSEDTPMDVQQPEHMQAPPHITTGDDAIAAAAPEQVQPH